MKYKILNYDSQNNWFGCEDESGKTTNLDLFTDASYKGFGNMRTVKDWDEKCRKLVGREIEVEDTSPYTPCFFAKNAKLLK